MSFPEPRSVLVVVLDNIGDLVFSSVLFQQLRARWPQTDLTVWCKKYTQDIAGLLPGAPRVFAADPFWHKSPGRKKGNWPDFFRALRALRREDFSLAIIASKPWRASAATALIGVKKRIAYAGAKSRWFVTDPVPGPPPTQEPVIQELNRLLAPLFPPDPSIHYRLERSALAPHQKLIMERRHAACGDAPYVVLHAFAGDPKRCMSLDQWQIVAEEIHRRKFKPLWVGSPAELERIRIAGPNLTDFCEFSDTYGSGRALDDAALIAGAALFIGHDSGPLHIASALGVPTVGLYLPSTPMRTSPQGLGATTVLHKDSAALIRADDVLAALEQAASRSGILMQQPWRTIPDHTVR
jgi:ADP-heptose:LPS heptosyltransferase